MCNVYNLLSLLGVWGVGVYVCGCGCGGGGVCAVAPSVPHRLPVTTSLPFPVGVGADPLEEKSREDPMWKPVEGPSEQEELISESVFTCIVGCN